jgi:hypothetical protein
MLYVREGEAIREGFGAPFPVLPRPLLNIAPISPGALFFFTIQPKTSYFRRGGRDSNAIPKPHARPRI